MDQRPHMEHAFPFPRDNLSCGGTSMNDSARFHTQQIPSLVLSMSAPIMFSLLIQALYNIVDSICVSSYSQYGLPALSLAFPLQLILTAVGNGTGMGAGILISRASGQKQFSSLPVLTANGLSGAVLDWVLVCAGMLPFLSVYYQVFSSTPQVVLMGTQYCQIVIFGSCFQFIESVCTRITQAHGCTFIPMMYQGLGALINMILDPLLVFGLGPFPSLGIPGAAIATVLGQCCAMVCALFTMLAQKHLVPPGLHIRTLLSIYRAGLPTMLTSALVSAYITGLNGVLATFSEDAVTSLGIYYKIQTFLLIPSYGLEQGTLPVLSYNIGAGDRRRALGVLRFSLLLVTALLLVGTIGVNLLLPLILALFSAGPQLVLTATPALRIISLAFPLFGITILIPALLQAAGRTRECLFVVFLRQVFLLVPLAVLLSRFGLVAVWFTFPISELIAAIVCVILFLRFRRQNM